MRTSTLLLGVDVGTTGAKAVLVDSRGALLATATTEYPLLMPRPGWTEQEPSAWWDATASSIRRVLDGARVAGAQVKAVGLTGQMHGLVPLDRDGRVLRPAILWNDQRTAEESAWITEHVGASRMIELTGNLVVTGFTAPKIIWMRRHEPALYGRVAHILLPKDYVRLCLTGDFATDVAEASGTSLFDVRRRRWSSEVLDALEIPSAWLPDVVESPMVSGGVTASAAETTGLSAGIPVVGGAGDQAAQAVGTGIVREGLVSATIGTSGVVFAHFDSFPTDASGSLHAFCHAVPGRWHVMGVMLSAGGSLRWLRDAIAHDGWSRSGDPYDAMAAEAEAVAPGADGLVFLPYLTGERTPHADAQARGAFVGLTGRHHRAHMIRAVMEGVAMGLRDSLELIRTLGLVIDQVRVSGGGARSQLWRQVLSDVFGAPVVRVNTTEGAAYGAALLAGVGTGIFPSVELAAEKTVTVTDAVSPRKEKREVYESLYKIYRSLYPRLQDANMALGAIGSWSGEDTLPSARSAKGDITVA